MSFEELLLGAIDEGLALLGDLSKQAFYYHLEETFNINRQDIPCKIEEFTDAIEKIFGTGAKIIQIQIMKCLFKKVGYTIKHYKKPTSLEFTEYIAAVRLAKKIYRNIKEQQPDSPYGEWNKKIVYLRTR